MARILAKTTFEKGFEAGLRSVLRTCLESKFGPLSLAARHQLDTFSLEQLALLEENLLTAVTLADLGLDIPSTGRSVSESMHHPSDSHPLSRCEQGSTARYHGQTIFEYGVEAMSYASIEEIFGPLKGSLRDYLRNCSPNRLYRIVHKLPPPGTIPGMSLEDLINSVPPDDQSSL